MPRHKATSTDAQHVAKTSPPNTGGKTAGREKPIPKKTKQYTDQNMIDALYHCSGLVLRAAKHLGCNPETIYRRVNTVPAVATALADARARAVDLAEDALHTRIEHGDTTAIIFLLKTLGKSRGYVERVEQAVSWQQELRDAGIDPEKAINALAVEFEKQVMNHAP